MRKFSHFQGKEPLFENLLKEFRFQKIRRLIPKNSTVLDLGCGYQAFLLRNISHLIKHGRGIDIRVVKDNLPKNIMLIDGNINNGFPNIKQKFDVVTALALIEHIKNPKSLVFHAHRFLKKGGKLIITTPSPYAKPVLEILAYQIHLISEQEIRDHKQYLSKSELYKILKNVGFEKIKVRYFQLGFNIFAEAIK